LDFDEVTSSCNYSCGFKFYHKYRHQELTSANKVDREQHQSLAHFKVTAVKFLPVLVAQCLARYTPRLKGWFYLSAWFAVTHSPRQ
jgi:hypothetical protein